MLKLVTEILILSAAGAIPDETPIKNKRPAARPATCLLQSKIPVFI